jgi:hypothetical protein
MDQALIAYRAALLNALGEVADAVESYGRSAEQATLQRARVIAQSEALRLANKRSTAGVISFIEVLDARRQLLAAETDLEAAVVLTLIEAGFAKGSAAGQPGDIAPGSCEVGSESGADGIGNEHEDDGDDGGRLLGGQGLRRSRGHDDVHIETDKLRGQLRKSLNLPAREPVLHSYGLSLDVSEFTHPLSEGVDFSRGTGRAMEQVTDAGKLADPLRLGNGLRG